MPRSITILFICICGVLLGDFAVAVEKWSYTEPNGPSTWPQSYPQSCSGNMQSPINILSKEAVYDGISDLVVSYDAPTGLNVTNKGHYISAKVAERLLLKGAGLPSTYELDSFHFHVGSVSSKGSEHQIDGQEYPMEMHLVHKDTKNPPSNTAVVLSVIFEEDSSDNTAFNKLTDNLHNISYPGQSVAIQSFSVKGILPSDISSFYRYNGSFTTPPCNESVEWIVFRKMAPISPSQLVKFRSVSSTMQSTKFKPLVNNYRPTQQLNGRIVRRNFDHLSFTCGMKTNLTADCRKPIDGHDVYYEIQANPCTLPVSVVLKINCPSLGFNTKQTLTEDLKTPISISSLKYGASLEMHFHSEGSNAGQLHVTVYHFPLAQPSKRVKVFDPFFQVEGVCQRSNCSSDTWNKHWCTSSIGIENPLLIGFASTINNPCGSPSMAMEVHRSEYLKQTWVLTAKLDVQDKQKYHVNLTNSLVGGKSLRMRKAVAKASKYTAVDLEAHIDKLDGGKTNFEIYLLLKGFGGHYLIFNTQYTNPNSLCSKNESSGRGTKVAVGIIVVVLVLIIIAIGGYILYRNRRAYFGHRPALVDEIEVQDADKL